jgi:hypothetical protein
MGLKLFVNLHHGCEISLERVPLLGSGLGEELVVLHPSPPTYEPVDEGDVVLDSLVGRIRFEVIGSGEPSQRDRLAESPG